MVTLKLLKNFPDCLQEELKFIDDDDNIYPIAHLGKNNIEIHFLHYKSKEEVEEKWSRRVSRLFKALETKTDLFFKFCDSENCTKFHLDIFHALPLEHKISFTVLEYKNSNNIYVPYLKDKKKNAIVNGLQLYKNRYRCFDFAYWILSRKISMHLYRF